MNSFYEVFPTSPVFKDHSHLKQIIEGMELLGRSEVIFSIGSGFFALKGRILQKVNFFDENSTIGSIEDDQKEILAELINLYEKKGANFQINNNIKNNIKFTFTLEGKRVFVSIESINGGKNVMARLKLKDEVLFAPRGLGFPRMVVEKILDLDTGLVIIASPSLGGRSTTAVSFFMEAVSRKNVLGLVLDDAMEFSLYSPKTMIIHKVYGKDFKEWFPIGNRVFSSVVYISDIDREEKLLLALQLASEGKLVFATICASSSLSLFHKMEVLSQVNKREIIRDFFAEHLRAVIFQNLIGEEGSLRKPALAFELILNTSKVKNFIMEGRYKMTLSRSPSASYIPYASTLNLLFKNGHISEREYKKELRMRTGEFFKEES